jgi:DNA-binding LacI/PurR family transcriptional regulator
MNITEFARRLNLSKGTVSRALNDRPEVSAETRRFVLERAEALGFLRNPNARRLATGRTHLIQLECPYNTNILSDQYLVELARGLENTAATHGFDLLLHLGTGAASGYEVPAVDGLIIVAGPETSLKDIRTLTAYGHTPAVVISDAYPTECAPLTSYVQIDTQSGVDQALARVKALGHKRIGYIRSDQAADNMQQMVEKAGLIWNPALTVQAGVTQKQGYEAAIRLLDQSSQIRPTVILTRTDILAVGTILAAQHLGLSVPADLSVVGHDDIDHASLVNPPLTTIAINIPNVAKEAMQMLTQLIDQTVEPSVQVFGTQLVFRSSLGTAPA